MYCSCGEETRFGQSQCPRCGKRLLFGTDPRIVLKDAAAGLSLVLALALVFYWAGKRSADEKPPAGQAGVRLVEGSQTDHTGQADRVRLAVTPFEYDDMGRLLDELGSGYSYHTIAYDDLLDAPRLEPYEVVFVTCSGVPRRWLGPRIGAGGRPGTEVHEARAEIVRQLRESLRQYVGQGGTLYASDWQFVLVAAAFPEYVAPGWPGRGKAQTVRADVLDPALAARLGPGVELNFDRPAWYPAAFEGPQVVVYLEGSYETISGRWEKAPLLVQFPFGKGSVIFTSFHNEKQHTEVEQELLHTLVLATVTARLRSEVQRTMLRGGFSPVQRNLLSASVRQQAVVRSFEHDGRGELQFVLGFEDQGAELRLEVMAPDGRQWAKSGTSTLVVEVPDAPAGRWQYKIEALRVPYANFPFTFSVGRKQPRPCNAPDGQQPQPRPATTAHSRPGRSQRRRTIRRTCVSP